MPPARELEDLQTSATQAIGAAQASTYHCALPRPFRKPGIRLQMQQARSLYCGGKTSCTPRHKPDPLLPQKNSMATMPKAPLEKAKKMQVHRKLDAVYNNPVVWELLAESIVLPHHHVKGSFRSNSI